MVWWTNQYKTCFVIIVSKLLHRGEAAVICFTIPSTSSNLVASTNLNLLILQLQLECSPAFHFFPLLVSETSSLLDLHKGEIQHEGWEGGSSPLPIMGDGHHPSFFPNHLPKIIWMHEWRRKKSDMKREIYILYSCCLTPTVVQMLMPLLAVSTDRKGSVRDYSCYSAVVVTMHGTCRVASSQGVCLTQFFFSRTHSCVCFIKRLPHLISTF